MLRVATKEYEIREVDFEVTLATSSAETRFEWDLNIRAFSDQLAPVRIRSHAAHCLEPAPVFPNPLAFGEWSASLPDEDPDGEPAFMAYCYEHEPLRDVVVKARYLSLGEVEFSMTARTDIFVAEDCPTDDVEITLQGRLRLGGFYVWGSNEFEASALVAQVADLRHFSSPVQRGPGFLFPLRHDA